jgi:protein-disulfide isomerase
MFIRKLSVKNMKLCKIMLKPEFFGFSLLFLCLLFCPIGEAAEQISTSAQLYYPTLNTVEGDANGRITIVEFFDYRCKYCHEVPNLLFNLIKNNPNIRIVYRDYPLLGPASILAAEAALSAYSQNKYLAMHRALLAFKAPLDETAILQLNASTQGISNEAAKKSLLKPEIMQQLEENIAMGKSLGIIGIPTFIVAVTPAINEQRPIMAYLISSPTLAELQTIVNNI